MRSPAREADRRRACANRTEPAAGSKVWLVVEAFHRSNGQRLWEYRTEATGPLPEVHEKHNLATPTPVTDGERVYAWFGNGQLVALDMDGPRRLDASSRRRILAIPDPLGARQLADAATAIS